MLKVTHSLAWLTQVCGPNSPYPGSTCTNYAFLLPGRCKNSEHPLILTHTLADATQEGVSGEHG